MRASGLKRIFPLTPPHILSSPLPGTRVESETVSATLRENFGATTNIEAALTLFDIAMQFELFALMQFVSTNLILESAV